MLSLLLPEIPLLVVAEVVAVVVVVDVAMDAEEDVDVEVAIVAYGLFCLGFVLSVVLVGHDGAFFPSIDCSGPIMQYSRHPL